MSTDERDEIRDSQIALLLATSRMLRAADDVRSRQDSLMGLLRRQDSKQPSDRQPQTEASR